MEQWRIKRYDITVMASHRQFTAEKKASSYHTSKGKKSLKHCVFYFFWRGFMRNALDVFIYSPSSPPFTHSLFLPLSLSLFRFFFSISLCVLFALCFFSHFKFRINRFVSLARQMNCHNECKINWLCRKIPLHILLLYACYRLLKFLYTCHFCQL